ncbi:unnamed protein product [Orchesella dallaii]|uniref:Odorant receptor n=1 Tax=Orchesella dallaii TaxID=48710 RepID=A0ABP1QHA3_9HEXA
MVTSLLLQAAHFNQKLSSYLPPHCISWDPNNCRWVYSNNWKKHLPHFCISFGVFGLVAYLQTALVTFTLITEPKIFSSHQLVINFLVNGGMQIVLIMDIMLVYCGKDLLMVTNWAVKSYQATIEHLEPSTWSNMIRLQNGKVDWYGFFAVYMSLVLCLGPFIFPVFLVHENSDAIYTLLLAISSHTPLSALSFRHTLLNNYFLKLTRFILTLIFGLAASVTIRMSTVMMMCLAQFSTSTLHSLSHSKLSLDETKLYRKLGVCLKILRNIVKKLVAAFLTFSFFMILILVILIVHGWKFLPLDIYLLSPCVLITELLFLNVSFHASCAVYEISGSAIQSWRRQLHYRQGYMKRILKSFHPIAAPVGSIGIMDRAIKANYVHATLDYTVNALVSTQDFL